LDGAGPAGDGDRNARAGRAAHSMLDKYDIGSQDSAGN
jgi:hypothetical protein